MAVDDLLPAMRSPAFDSVTPVDQQCTSLLSLKNYVTDKRASNKDAAART